MATLDIVGLGLSTLDVLMRLRDMPTWERPGSLSDFALEGGGPVGTACVAAARLGARVGFVGRRATIWWPNSSCSLQQQEDLRRTVVRQQPDTQLIMVYVQQETGSGLLARSSGPHPLPCKSKNWTGIITSARTCTWTEPTQRRLQAAPRMRGRQAGLPGWFQDGRAAHLTAHGSAGGRGGHLICGSGFGRSVTGQSDLWAAGEAILAAGPRIVVQTEGADGSYTVTATERFHLPAFDVPVVDTTGAGRRVSWRFSGGAVARLGLQSRLFATAYRRSSAASWAGAAASTFERCWHSCGNEALTTYR